MARIFPMMMVIARQRREKQKRQQEQRKREQKKREQRYRQQREHEQKKLEKQKHQSKPKVHSNYTGDHDENGIANGQGTFADVYGNIYEGEWKNGKRDGYGIQELANHCIYYGNWKDDIMHGKGIMYDVINHQRTCGFWNNGVYQKRSPRLMNLKPENNGILTIQKKYKNYKKQTKNKQNNYIINQRFSLEDWEYPIYTLVIVSIVLIITFLCE